MIVLYFYLNLVMVVMFFDLVVVELHYLLIYSYWNDKNFVVVYVNYVNMTLVFLLSNDLYIVDVVDVVDDIHLNYDSLMIVVVVVAVVVVVVVVGGGGGGGDSTTTIRGSR
eukprot:609336_1